MKIQLRSWELSDVDSLARYANNYNIAKKLTNHFPHPYTREDANNYIQLVQEIEKASIFAISLNGEAVGSIGLHFQGDIFIKNAELGYWLAEPFWGKGIMTKAIKEIVAYGFENHDINRIFARPFGDNIGSQKVLEKAGFQLEAKFEKTLFKNEEYKDELVYAIRRA